MKRNPAVLLTVLIIRAYQVFLSPMFGRNCRFYPTCSQYTLEAVRQYGFIRGCFMGIRRIVKCGPWHPGGYDPVPGAHARKN